MTEWNNATERIKQSNARICLWYFIYIANNTDFGRREFADLSFILHNFLVISEDFVSIYKELKTLY